MGSERIDRLREYLKLVLRGKDFDRIFAKPPSAAAGSALESMPTDEGLEHLDQQFTHARVGADTLLNGGNATDDQLLGLEAIILPDLRPAVDIIGGTYELSHELWTHLNQATVRSRLQPAIRGVGRIELPGNTRYPYGGTGFVVGDGLLMTNRHVAAIFTAGVGKRGLGFRAGHRAAIHFGRERNAQNEGGSLEVRRVRMIHPYWDMALLEVEGLDPTINPLTLSLSDVSALSAHEVAVIGYPAFDPRNDAAEQRKLFDGTFGVKRLQPGQVHGRADTESFGKKVSAAVHDCSTLGGNSGSAVVDIGTGHVLALHFGGRYHDKNFGVPSFELARDSRVVDEGVKFTGPTDKGPSAWEAWWTDNESAAADSDPATPTRNLSRPVETGLVVTAPGDNSVTIEIPLQITVRLGNAARAIAAVATPGPESVSTDGLEGLVEPWHETDYRGRNGYSAKFLGVDVPMPGPVDSNVLALTKSGATVLIYQNFSIQMHAARRLALIAASNVTAEKKLRRPEASATYTRKALSGLGKNDQERWFLDARLSEDQQLPDVFFTKDRKAFDKGHIVRRDDVAWGETYDTLRRANGDTYHVTNCSPQTGGFNRSADGEDNWGDLENHVLSSASSERLAVFAGPVLDRNDTVFQGVGTGGTRIRAKIPSRYWKVVVARVLDGLASYGFVLEQDLSDVAFESISSEEFAPADEFVPYMYPIKEIGKMTGVKFAKSIIDADQFDTDRGAEVAFGAMTPPKRQSSK